jgi:alginate O-acetyltransferase complex protein AlgI
MRPLRSFLLLLIFLACFTGLYYVVPKHGLFPEISEYVPVSILRSFATEEIKHNYDTISLSTVEEDSSDVSVKYSSPVNHVEDSEKVNLLNPFFDSLRYSKRQKRILYYGDSQIEGDRITSYLRKTLQEENGGKGPGLFLPVMPVMYTKSIWLKSSSNWARYNYLSFKNGELSHKKLGPFMTICRYLHEGETTSSPVKAYISIRPSKYADSLSSKYDLLRLFYSNREGCVYIIVKADGREVYSDTLSRGNNFNELTCNLNNSKEIFVEFTGKVSPDIYGISIESNNGVIVDNIPQRGSAGLEFTMVDRKNLKEALNKLSPDLIILHYGLNIVKNVRNNYDYYRKGLERQLSLLKNISPATPILVIGLTDMASNEGDSITSYRNIPSIIEAQKEACIKSGVTYWDSYTMMGGKESIINWTKRKPPLAQSDYVHLTYQGADTLAKMIFETILSDTSVELQASDIQKYKTNDNSSHTINSTALVTEHTKVRKISETIISQLLSYDPAKPLIFSTAAFWVFFLFVLAGYSLIYRKHFIRNFYLFIVSLFFYYKSGGFFLLLLILVTLIDFTCGLLIHKSKTRLSQRLILLVSIMSNLCILAYFKYTGFVVDTINDFFGTNIVVSDFLAAFANTHLGTSFNVSDIVLPVGISFFTFQSLSYTFDVYRKKIEPVRNVVNFGFYVSFFPQLVAGPIVRASEFIPQLYGDFHLTKNEFSHSLFLISKGLIKKIVISDFIAVTFIDRVFDAPSLYSGFENLLAIYGYGLQIYCDFSGYTDIAIGLALILGFRLPVNFNSPYKATSLSDFWKRWHISLSRWLKDYLYIPLGGNRKGKIRTQVNLLITMLIGGLWHGASIRFIIWGALHGIGLVINRTWNMLFSKNRINGKVFRFISVFITFQFVCFCWIFFRAPDMNSVSIMLKQIFENFSPGSYLNIITVYYSFIVLLLVGYIIHFLPEKTKESYRGIFIKIPLLIQLFIIMVVAIILFRMRATEVTPFIYFRF